MMSAPVLALCQDCLAVHRFASADVVFAADERSPSGNALCVCGGDVCCCPGCQRDAALLEGARVGVESGSVCNTRTLCNGLQAE